MSDPREQISIATLGDLRRHGYRLSGFCRTCGRGWPIDLDALIARLGADHSYLADALRLRCVDCGGPDTGIAVLAPGR